MIDVAVDDLDPLERHHEDPLFLRGQRLHRPPERLEALLVYDFAEEGVLPVEVRGRAEHHRERRAARVRVGLPRHRDQARPVVPRPSAVISVSSVTSLAGLEGHRDLGRGPLPGIEGEGAAPAAAAAADVSELGDEPLVDPEKVVCGVEPELEQSQDVRRRPRGDGGPELDLELAVGGLEDEGLLGLARGGGGRGRGGGGGGEEGEEEEDDEVEEERRRR